MLSRMSLLPAGIAPRPSGRAPPSRPSNLPTRPAARSCDCDHKGCHIPAAESVTKPQFAQLTKDLDEMETDNIHLQLVRAFLHFQQLSHVVCYQETQTLIRERFDLQVKLKDTATSLKKMMDKKDEVTRQLSGSLFIQEKLLTEGAGLKTRLEDAITEHQSMLENMEIFKQNELECCLCFETLIVPMINRIHTPPILSGFLWKVINVFHAVDGMIGPDTHLSASGRGAIYLIFNEVATNEPRTYRGV
ncbi:uncharacterized protein EV420DRAFT_1486539 [Desarmillaria tabescens]|uniref:Uncharacterized protein n=1 Tax=Armillaria tabescens TaxID=1929756 RepID=A0AA39MM19_ARMTA|nr:uncharacterized protein EV420DRAFT_1486539 [Desarmillaria tabescens]KAK0438888.1 hypothetical protein EV420DRAFT_1486539 [Desarmillaria tabescens]